MNDPRRIRIVNGVALLCSLSTVVVIFDIFRSLDALPREFTAFEFGRPTLALALLLFAFAALSLGATAAATFRTSSFAIATGLALTSLITVIAAWAMHQALWHLVHGLSHAGPYWFGKS